MVKSKKTASKRTIRALRLHQGGASTRPYDRERDLPRLLPLHAEDLFGKGEAAQRRLLELLRRALRAERARANARHFAYNPARHAALARAARHEVAAQRRPFFAAPCAAQSLRAE